MIKPGDVIATLVPKDLNFHIEVDIDPADITHVYEGATVKVMLDFYRLKSMANYWVKLLYCQRTLLMRMCLAKKIAFTALKLK